MVEPPGVHFRAKAQPDRANQFGAIDDEPMRGRLKKAISASLNPQISGGGQRPPTKFDTLVEPLELNFPAKAGRDRANEFGAIDNEPMPEKRKMATFARLNPHISGVGQSTPAKFGRLVEPLGTQFYPEARWDRENHFCAIDDEVRHKCAKIGTPGKFGAT